MKMQRIFLNYTYIGILSAQPLNISKLSKEMNNCLPQH